jgi:cellobiose-specific phosphotransferase system component IIC
MIKENVFEEIIKYFMAPEYKNTNNILILWIRNIMYPLIILCGIHDNKLIEVIIDKYDTNIDLIVFTKQLYKDYPKLKDNILFMLYVS